MSRRTGSPAAAYEVFRTQVLQGVERLLLERRDDILHPDPGLAVRLGLRAVLGVLDAVAVPESDVPSPSSQVEEATTLLLAYLSFERRPPPSSAQADFFFVWS
jgi:hypothetical protein